MKIINCLGFVLILSFLVSCKSSENEVNSSVSEIGLGWSKTSVNAPIFRKNSIVSANGFQFVAYYDSSASVVLAKRLVGTDNWQMHTTQYKGNVFDAHNVICIAVDGDGFLHMSWDHHNNSLNYCKSVEPYSLELGPKLTMLGRDENVVSYPEFYKFSNGDLLFAYRDGGSGNGNLVLNRYDRLSQNWRRIQTNLIDGEGMRNAYWQIHLDANDQIMVSWVWRETPDVASNHDLCYARSADGGKNWVNSTGETYEMPIKMRSADVIEVIPQKSNLINQTSMTSDEAGNAYIVTYYKAKKDSCTQIQLIYQQKGKWMHSTVSNRTTDFNLSGMGSRSIPVSRPQIVIADAGKEKKIHVIYRDEEFDNKVCISTANMKQFNWTTQTVSSESVGRWEPSFDSELWKNKQELHLFMQNVGQGQGETSVDMKPQMVGVLNVNLDKL